MVNSINLPGQPRPPPPPPPPPRFPRITGYHLKQGKHKRDKLKSYLEKFSNLKKESELVTQDRSSPLLPKIIRPDQEQYQTEVNVGSGSRTIPDDWVILIQDKLVQANREEDRTSWGKLSIYKIPHYLLSIYKIPHYLHGSEDNSYFPQTVSIGPYHHRDEKTQSMECHKWRAVNKILKRTKQGIEMFMEAMRDLEEEARACYEGSISLNSYEFTEMLLLDGCFVLELFIGAHVGFSELGYDRNDPVFAMRGSMHSIRRDMMMLENQLPLFVLNRLLELQPGTQSKTGSVKQLAVWFFDPLVPTAENSQGRGITVDPSADLGDLHCLDIFRRSLLFPKQEPKPSGKRWSWGSNVTDKRLQQMIPSVTELRDAGFRFRIRKTDRFWDIKFNEGYLEIPSLHIHDGTKSLFLNLIAFEQCHIDSSNNITSYIIFMDNLIDRPEDISYLHSRGIIEHSLGSNSEVADIFNQLCQEVVFNTNDIYLSELLTEVLRCYNQNWFRKWNAWTTTLQHKYFDNPWAYFSFFAALILLLLTFFQTYFAAYDYF